MNPQRTLLGTKQAAESHATALGKGWTVRPFTCDNGREVFEVVAPGDITNPPKRSDPFLRMRAYQDVDAK